jgi:hypothetical protein
LKQSCFVSLRLPWKKRQLNISVYNLLCGMVFKPDKRPIPLVVVSGISGDVAVRRGGRYGEVD